MRVQLSASPQHLCTLRAIRCVKALPTYNLSGYLVQARMCDFNTAEGPVQKIDRETAAIVPSRNSLISMRQGSLDVQVAGYIYR